MDEPFLLTILSMCVKFQLEKLQEFIIKKNLLLFVVLVLFMSCNQNNILSSESDEELQFKELIIEKSSDSISYFLDGNPYAPDESNFLFIDAIFELDDLENGNYSVDQYMVLPANSLEAGFFIHEDYECVDRTLTGGYCPQCSSNSLSRSCGSFKCLRYSNHWVTTPVGNPVLCVISSSIRYVSASCSRCGYSDSHYSTHIHSIGHCQPLCSRFGITNKCGY